MQTEKKSKRVTIQDVAKKADVSPSTVSHVMNQTASISEATRERVIRAMEELQYHPNINARSLRKRQTHMIGLIIQDITSQFYSIMYERFLIRLQQDGYLLLIMCGQWDNERTAQNIETLIEHQVDGLIVVGYCGCEDMLRKAEECGIKVVLCDQYSPNFPSVEWNNYMTMRKLVHCFVADERKRIGYVCADSHRMQDSGKQRFKGYSRGMLDENLDPEKYIFFLNEKEGKYFKWGIILDRYTTYLLELPPDKRPQVILTEHDAIAQGIVMELTKSGIRVPEDIQVFGFDDTSHTLTTQPKLSTVRQDPVRLADETFEMLFHLMKDQPYPRHVCLEQTIILRESGFILPDFLEREQLSYVSCSSI